MRQTGLLHGALATLIAVACGPSPAPHAATKVSLLGAPEFAAEAFPTPAVWRYQPREAAPLLSRLTLPGGATLFAGSKGERWLVAPHSEIAEAAPELAPETLVAIVSSGDGGFLFLGQSGTSYEAREPLGPFVKSSAPLEPLVHVSAAGKVLVGVRLDGAIVRSDTAGGAWSRVGPESERFQDVALLPDGRGLALAVPEGYWETRDYAATFTRLDATTLGSLALAVDATAGLVVKTVQGAYRWDPGAAPPAGPFAKASGPLAPPVQSLGVALPIGPSAAALAEGRAIALRDQWLELRATSASSYALVRGALGAPLTRSAFPLANGCTDVRVTGNAQALYVACARDKSTNVTQPLEIHRSLDGGGTWKIEPYVVEGRVGELSMAVAGDGALVVSGVCSSALRGPGCAPAGIQRRAVVPTDSGTGIDLAAAATPSLAGSVLGLVTSPDGRVVYALGRRSKGDALAVFVSRDGGATFDARDVEGLVVPDDEGRMRGQTPSVVLESAAAAEDGTVAFVLLQGRKRAWLVVDEDGRTLALAKPPVEGARLGAVGQRGLAVNMASREAWESLDGGATFASLGKLPVDPCPGMADCSAKIACVARGCVLGDIVSRIGFREAQRARLLAPPSTDHGHQRAEPHVATPFSCTLDPGEWRKLPGTLGPPSVDQAAIGRLAWLVLRHDPLTAAVSVQGPRLGQQAGRQGPTAIDEVTLLPPAPRGAEVAYTASIQIEGVAALRYPLPGTKGSRDPDLRNIEVAWDDALLGHVGHAIIPDGGPYRPGDYGDKGSPRLASPALVSIASGGVYVRPHRALGDDQPTYFVDGHSLEVVPPVPWPAETQRSGRTEMTRIDRSRTHVPIRIDGGTVVRARRAAGGGWAFDAVSMGFADPRLFARTEHGNIAYAGAAAGLHFETTDERARESMGLLYPFRADGAVLDAPTHVPTAADLPATPRPCSAGDRGTTPRVVVPFQPGTRHPVIVTDAIEPLRVLLTDAAVLHGTPESPCAAAFDTEFVSSEAATPGIAEQAVVFVDPAEHSWLFRSPSGAREPTTAFEARSMTCRFDPAAEVPIEVFRMKGTLVPPR